MNNLSWFIYLTQVVDAIGVLCAVTIVLGGIASIITLVIGHVEESERTTSLGKRILAGVCVAAVVGTVVPSRQTMLLIAGSEMGERIVKSDAVKDIVNPGADLLKAWIKDETDKITNKKK